MKLSPNLSSATFSEIIGIDIPCDLPIFPAGPREYAEKYRLVEWDSIYYGAIPMEFWLQYTHIQSRITQAREQIGIWSQSLDKISNFPSLSPFEIKELEDSLGVVKGYKFSPENIEKAVKYLKKNIHGNNKFIEEYRHCLKEIKINEEIPADIIAAFAKSANCADPHEFDECYVYYPENSQIESETLSTTIDGQILVELDRIEKDYEIGRNEILETIEERDPEEGERVYSFYIDDRLTGISWIISQHPTLETIARNDDGESTSVLSILRNNVLCDMKFSQFVPIVGPQKEFIGLWSVNTNTLCIANFIPFRGLNSTSRDSIESIKNIVKKMLTLVGKHTNEKKATKKSAKIFLGSDIEFIVFDSDSQYHSATEFVRDSLDGQIGTDGNVETLEIRPDHSQNPIEIVDNIESLLKNLSHILPPGHDLLGGGGDSLGRSTGIHIHFSGTSMDTGKRGSGSPLAFCAWLDWLLNKPVILFTKGWKRGDDHYGRPSDYRNRDNHREFPHTGFEYRTLPTVCLNRKITESIFVIARMAIDTFEKGESVTFDEKKFSREWYMGLHKAKENQLYIDQFVDWILGKPSLDMPILQGWFGKKFEKDRECDIIVEFESDEDGYLDIAPFVMYNPQRKFTNVIIWSSRNERKNIVLSSNCDKLQSWLVGEMGLGCESNKTPSRILERFSNEKRKRPLYVGIHYSVLAKLRQKSHGSRNYVKMFAQDIVKNI